MEFVLLVLSLVHIVHHAPMVLVALYVLSDILVLLAQAVILAIKEPAVMPVLLVISQVQVDAYHVLT